MNSTDRADLIFDLAAVLNEYADDRDCDPDEITMATIGFVRGWRDDN